LLAGNRQVRDRQDSCLGIVAQVFKWDREKAKAELAKVHLSNLPENQAFFSGSIDSAGNYGGIYQSAMTAYGRGLIKDAADGGGFLDLKPLTKVEQSGAFKDQEVAIAPIRQSGYTAAADPLLTKDIRFLFEPNTFILRLGLKENQKNLEAIKQMLQVSPGSKVLLIGHVDNGMVEEFRKKGGERFVKAMALKAMELSQHRALEIKRLLVERYEIAPARLDAVGRGWNEPAGADNERNRRVQAQWFTVQ
jgi:NitT/TauT family transport system substrate-binding protein